MIESEIDWIAQEFTKTRQYRFDKSEDALTVDIVTILKARGFNASHDTQYGGHCDIIVEGKNGFLWIAEAKIHRSYGWLLKGFQQLDTRYSTGLNGQNAGEIIIYCLNKRMDKLLEKWEAKLRAARPDVNVECCENDLTVRRSTHVHQATGNTFRVRHKGISLYFDPDD